jgi:putative hydrolase of the HAD superfamily
LGRRAPSATVDAVIRAVISDFGGVLTTPIAGSFQAFAERSGVELALVGKALATVVQRDGVHPLYELECGRISEATFLRTLELALREEIGREVKVGDFTELMWAGLAPNTPMIELMAQLRAEGYRMALLTNNVREWEARWRAMVPIDDIFELVVDSAFVGMRKPDPEIYELTVARLGMAAEECLFIDDFEHNCEAARAVGMSAVVYRDLEQAVAEIRAALGNGAV